MTGPCQCPGRAWAVHLLPCANSVRDAALQTPATQLQLAAGLMLLVWAVPGDVPYGVDHVLQVYRPARGTDDGEVLATGYCVGCTREQAVKAGEGLVAGIELVAPQVLP